MPHRSLRQKLAELHPTPEDRATHRRANAGLWLDRFLPHQLTTDERLGQDEHPNTTLIKTACDIPEPSEYATIFRRWHATVRQHALPQYPYIEQREAHVRGRMAVGHGADGVLETAITLHRTYGVPYIPGSALKGLAAAYAHQFLDGETWRKEVRDNQGQVVTALGAAHKIMFGDTTSAGYITFFDALYVPGSGHAGKALWPDVITVHHPEYYQEQRTERDGTMHLPPPADWDSPTPVSFISATGRYLVVLAGPMAWVESAFDIMALALDELGIGGKTATGYGRLTLDNLERAHTRRRSLAGNIGHRGPTNRPDPDNEPLPPEPEVPRIFAQQVAQSNAGSLPNIMPQWRELPPDVQQAAAQMIIDRAVKIKVKKLEEKSWYQELVAALQE